VDIADSFWQLANIAYEGVNRGLDAGEAWQQAVNLKQAAIAGDSAEGAREHSLQSRASNLYSSYYLVPDALSGMFSRRRTATDVSPYGYLTRDLNLREMYLLQGNDLIQSATAVMAQKVKTTSYVIEGPSRTAKRANEMLLNSDLGNGWDILIPKTVQDYCLQDNGFFWEVIWSDASRAVTTLEYPSPGAEIVGFAHMDAGRCRRTGDPEHPVIYQSLTGSMHRIHWSRIVFEADMPNPDERYLGRGFCALSRCLSTARAAIRYSTYRDELLDDLPPLGLLIMRNVNVEFWTKAKAIFGQQRTAEGQYFFSNVMPLFSMDATKPVEAELTPFKSLWENFTEKDFYDKAIDFVAMGFGLDRQDLAPLNTAGIGSGAQSNVLSRKSQGKGIGNMLTSLERKINELLPSSVTFKFDFHDDEEDMQQAHLRNQKAETILALTTGNPTPIDPNTGAVANAGIISRQEARQILVHEIPEWSQYILTPDDGEAQFTDIDDEALAPADRQLQAATKALKRYGRPIKLHKSGKITSVPKEYKRIMNQMRWGING
jgi:hypothetical protein